MKALILCGGKGERLKPLTNHIPKPMVQINKKPILEYVIDHILSFNIDEIILLTGYKGQLIKDKISDKYINKNIVFSNSGDVDIIKRINNVASFLDDDFLLFYGDTISDVNINALIKHHSMLNSDMTMTLWPLRSQFGIIDINSENMIYSYKEKPILDHWINIGYFYINHRILSNMKKYDKFELFLLDLVKKRNVSGFKHKGAHITVNTIQELEEAEKNIFMINKGR